MRGGSGKEIPEDLNLLKKKTPFQNFPIISKQPAIVCFPGKPYFHSPSHDSGTHEVFLCPAEEFFEFFLIFVDIFGSHEQSLQSNHCVALQLLFFDKFAQKAA